MIPAKSDEKKVIVTKKGDQKVMEFPKERPKGEKKNDLQPEAQNAEEKTMKYSKKDLKNWRRRGFYNENALVTFLKKRGYNAVRIPCSNPSMNPLPDVIGRKEMHIYAYETKKAKYYCYFQPHQIEKLFGFLDEVIPLPNQYKHAVLVAHIGKKWIFKTAPWANRNTFTDNIVIKKCQHSEKIP